MGENCFKNCSSFCRVSSDTAQFNIIVEVSKKIGGLVVRNSVSVKLIISNHVRSEQEKKPRATSEHEFQDLMYILLIVNLY